MVRNFYLKSAPYHPASNGQVERFVQSLKQALKASQADGRSLEQRLYSFLLTYRSSPHSTTGVTPASLFLNRALRTKFDVLKPSVESQVLEKQSSQKACHDRRAKERGWSVGQTVLARSLRPGPDWVPATIVEKLGPVTYTVETRDQQYWKRHADQLKEFMWDTTQDVPAPTRVDVGPEDSELATAPPLVPPPDDETLPTEDVVDSSTQPTEDVPEISPLPNLEPVDDGDPMDNSTTPVPPENTSSPSTVVNPAPPPATRRYSARKRIPRKFYEPGIGT